MVVWKLETPNEEMACYIVNDLYTQARAGKTRARNILKKCFYGNWNDIKEKMETEGSVWYVWYMEGVGNFMRKYLND